MVFNKILFIAVFLGGVPVLTGDLFSRDVDSLVQVHTDKRGKVDVQSVVEAGTSYL